MHARTHTRVMYRVVNIFKVEYAEDDMDTFAFLFVGRDTPSSQITEGDEGRVAGEARQLDLPSSNIPTKQSRSEIDDKFCKFEIKKLIEGISKLEENEWNV